MTQNLRCKLWVTRDVKNAFHAFETSWETDNLESEENRKIYCDMIDLSYIDDNSNNWNEMSIKNDKFMSQVTDKPSLDDFDDDINDEMESRRSMIKDGGKNMVD